MEESIKVVLAEDKELFRGILRQIVEPFNIKIIAEAENGKILLSRLRSHAPHVVLLDLDMPVMDGSEAFNNICKQYPGMKVIILSLHSEAILIENFQERGASGYIPKDIIMANPVILINAIKKVKDGGVFFYQEHKEKEKFTKRQKEIMPLIFDGLTNNDISDKIGISKRAVEKQRQKLYQKSGAERTIDFYKYAFSRGFQFLGPKGRS